MLTSDLPSTSIKFPSIVARIAAIFKALILSLGTFLGGRVEAIGPQMLRTSQLQRMPSAVQNTRYLLINKNFLNIGEYRQLTRQGFVLRNLKVKITYYYNICILVFRIHKHMTYGHIFYIFFWTHLSVSYTQYLIILRYL